MVSRSQTLAAFVLVAAACCIAASECANSYHRLADKSIDEEKPLGSFVADLVYELESSLLSSSSSSINSTHSRQQQQQQPYHFTLLLEDSMSKSDASSFFHMDANSGLLTTRQLLDREELCATGKCADPCTTTAANANANANSDKSHLGACRISLNILLMPAYTVLNLNVFVEDVNDNAPSFVAPSRNATTLEANQQDVITLHVDENVPVGFKLPLDEVLGARDPDVGRNAIQRYQLKALDTNRSSNSTSSFALEFVDDSGDSAPPQLQLVVLSALDREERDSYELEVAAFDGDERVARVRLRLVVDDANDNAPVFERSAYAFVVAENVAVDTKLGAIRATDADQALNARIKYSLVDSSSQQQTPPGQQQHQQHSPKQQRGQYSLQLAEKYF